jgi:RimJ/RimL family protein N-acetyltransferase
VPPPVELSILDEERFGIRSAKAKKVTGENLPEILDFCHQHQVIFLIARCMANDFTAIHTMEQSGFLLMDTLVYMGRNISKIPLPADQPSALIRKMEPGEEPTVVKIARESFKGYFGHYHADPRLNPQTSTEAYISWAERSCYDPEVANCVLVAEVEKQLVGFLTVRLITPHQGELVLGGVLPQAQGHGVYKSYIIKGMEWCKEQGADEVITSTQIINIAVQKVWARLGFEIREAYYTFHKWF